MYAERTSASDEKQIKARIEAIPGAMREMGWNVSAALMERWLTSPAWELPQEWKSKSAPNPATMSRTHLDDSIVRMSWALTHASTRHAMTALRAMLTNEAAKGLLKDRLTDLVASSKDRIQVGQSDETAISLDKRFLANSLSFGGTFRTMDDMYGALGRATIKGALIGEAFRDEMGRIVMDVEQAGYYICDTYDFTGFQYLGTWTRHGVLNKTQMLVNAALDGMLSRWGGEPIGNIYNHDFESYRRLTRRGGDFVIYSDVHWEKFEQRVVLG